MIDFISESLNMKDAGSFEYGIRGNGLSSAQPGVP
jgi:hypothetical protein